MGEEEARPVCRHPSACPTGPCRRGRRAWRPSKPPEGKENKDADVGEKIKGKGIEKVQKEKEEEDEDEDEEDDEDEDENEDEDEEKDIHIL